MRRSWTRTGLCAAGCWLIAGCYTGVDRQEATTANTDPGGLTTAGTGSSSSGGADTGGESGDPELPEPDDGPPAPGREFECEAAQQDPGPTIARRLNRPEFLNSVRDSLGVDAWDLAAQLPPDYRAEGFTNTAQALILSTDDVASLAEVATEIVSRVPDPAALVAAHTSCTDFTDPCTDEFIERIGKRVLRRPLDTAQVAAYRPLFAFAQEEGDTFVDGASMVIEAMLQSPHFMYRIELQAEALGPYRPLDDYEIASRLSYLVWGAPPDDALMAAADAGLLGDPEERLAQVQRLVAAEATRETTRRFVGDWIHLDRLDTSPSPLAADLREEAEAFFESVVWDEARPLSDLLNARYTYASEALATAYGYPDPKPGLQRYELEDIPERAGMITQGAVLSWEDGHASMVQRGLFVLREVICAQISPPPPGVNDTPPEPEPGKSKRHYAELRMETSPCNGCHIQIDPIGFALEHYDGDGLWMETDEHGNELRSDGELLTQFHPGIPFDDAREMADLLAADARVAECMLLNVAQFSLGRRLAKSDGCTLAAIRDSVSAEGATYQELLEAMVVQPSFAQIRSADQAEGE